MVRAAALLILALVTAGCVACRPLPTEPSAPTPGDADATTIPAATSPTPIETQVIEGVEYLPGRVLTVIRPVDEGPWATVVALHGIGLSPRDMYPLAEALAERGVVVFLPDWGAPSPTENDARAVTLGWEHAAAAIRFARTNASTYGAQSGRLIAVGHSWGASVATAMALAGDEFALEGTDKSASALPDAVVALDGPMDTRVLISQGSYESDRKLWDRMNPTVLAERVRLRSGVEFRLFIGGTWPDGDASNTALAEQLEAKGGPVSLRNLNRSHMEMVQPLDQIVESILDLADE